MIEIDSDEIYRWFKKKNEFMKNEPSYLFLVCNILGYSDQNNANNTCVRHVHDIYNWLKFTHAIEKIMNMWKI